MGLHPWEFDQYTLSDFSAKLKGLSKKRNRELQEHWQQLRIIGYYIISPYLPKSQKHKSPFDIVPDIYEKAKSHVELKAWYQNQKQLLVKLGLENASRN